VLSSGLFIGVCSLNANITERTVFSDKLAFKVLAQVHNPEERIRNSEYGKNYKNSRKRAHRTVKA
jgi:hypothetical protein